MKQTLLAFLLCLFAFDADGQGEWIELQTCGSESVLGSYAANDSDGVACNMLNSYWSYGGMPATIFFQLPYLPATDTVRIVRATTIQAAGVELEVFACKEFTKQDLWVLRAGFSNPESGTVLNAIPDSEFYGERPYAFIPQPHVLERFVGVTRPLLNDTLGLNGYGDAGVDCLSVYVDTTARHKRTLGVAVRGEHAAPVTRHWVNVIGESVGTLDHAIDGVYFSERERAVKRDGVIYYSK